METPYRSTAFGSLTLPFRNARGLGLPTPPEEHSPAEDTMLWEIREADGEVDPWTARCVTGHSEAWELGMSEAKGQRAIIGQMAHKHDLERQFWKAHIMELQMENQHMRHTLYTMALDAPQPSVTTSEKELYERSDTRTARKQLACMDEYCESLMGKMARLQEQTAEAQRLLAQERQERLEERNNQLTVVVAKHGLERRMRNREQDLQAEWRRNAELSERCQRLEEEVRRVREGGNGHPFGGGTQGPVRPDYDRTLDNSIQNLSMEDDWTDTHRHDVPEEFGYSKFVRWKKRAREGHDRGVGHGKKQRTTNPGPSRMQLAGSESPPQLQETSRSGQAGPGASAIDQMICGEFVESETP